MGGFVILRSIEDSWSSHATPHEMLWTNCPRLLDRWATMQAFKCIGGNAEEGEADYAFEFFWRRPERAVPPTESPVLLALESRYRTNSFELTSNRADNGIKTTISDFAESQASSLPSKVAATRPGGLVARFNQSTPQSCDPHPPDRSPPWRCRRQPRQTCLLAISRRLIAGPARPAIQ
jgi:hypothetical protein